MSNQTLLRPSNRISSRVLSKRCRTRWWWPILASSYRTLRLQPCYDRWTEDRVEDRFSSDDGCGRDIARDNGATMRLIHQCDNVRAHKLTPSKLLEYRVGSMYRNEISVCNALNKLLPIGSIYLVSFLSNKKIVDS